MSTDRCEQLLLDILSGELGEGEERAARAEVARCEEHAEALSRMQTGLRWAAMLPVAEPRAELDDAIMAAARARRADRKSGTGSPGHDTGFWVRALSFLRRVATGPQVAMSTVMLLVVAIGFWYVPHRDHRVDVDGHTVMAPSGREMAIARGGPRSAEPPAAAPTRDAEAVGDKEPSARGTDERARRSTGGGGLARRGTASPRSEPTVGRGARPNEGPTRQPAPREADARPSARAVASSPSPSAGASDVRRRAPSARSDSLGAEDAPMAPAARPSIADRSAQNAEISAASGAPGAAAGAGPGDAVAGPGDPFAQGMSLYRAQRYPEAVQRFRAAVAAGGAQLPSALHHLGRSHRSAGQCAAALPPYERLLSGYPSYPERTPAMIEAAHCYRRTGRLDLAEQWLERAAASTPSSAVAQRELARIRALRQPERAPPAAEEAH